MSSAERHDVRTVTATSGVRSLRPGVQGTLAGLVVGIAGLGVQWAVDPAKFNPFPPGIGFIAAFGLLTLLTRKRWWSPAFAVAIAGWVVFGGLAANKLLPNLRSHNFGTVAGTVIMTLGLLAAAAIGVIAIVQDFRRRRRLASTTDARP